MTKPNDDIYYILEDIPTNRLIQELVDRGKYPEEITLDDYSTDELESVLKIRNRDFSYIREHINNIYDYVKPLTILEKQKLIKHCFSLKSYDNVESVIKEVKELYKY